MVFFDFVVEQLTGDAEAVGGLRDTVKDGRTGFSFTAKSTPARVKALLSTLQRSMKLFLGDQPGWQKMRKAAAAQRFSWADSIDAYLQQLYRRE